MKSFFMSCLLLSLMITSVFTSSVIEINIGEATPVDSADKVIDHNVHLPATIEKNYLRVLTSPESNVNPGMIYLETLSASAENMGDNVYYIPKEQLTEEDFGFSVKCLDACKYNITVEWADEKSLILGNDITMYGTKESTETETAVETFVFDTLNVNAMIYYYTYNLNDVNSTEMTYILPGGENEVTATKNEIGYAFIAEPLTEGAITIKIKGLDKKKKITIGAREYNSLTTGGRVYSNEYVFLKKGVKEEQCFSSIRPLISEKLLIMNINYLSSTVTLTMKFASESSESIQMNYAQYTPLYPTAESFCASMPTLDGYDEFVVFTYQLIYSEDILTYQNVIAPIYNDFIYKRYLPKDNIMNYKFPFSIDSDFYPNAHISDNFGSAVLYAYDCGANYPCSLTKEQFDTAKAENKLILANELNGDYTITQDKSTFIFIVHCASSKHSACEYHIDLSMIQKKQSMLEHYINLVSEYDYFINSKVREFKCKLDNPSLYEKVQFTVSSFSGSCYIDFVDNDKYTLKAVRGKIIYEFAAPLRKEYKMEVKGGESGKSCIVAYEYNFENTVFLRSGRQNIEHISLKEKKKSYKIIRRDEDFESYYALTIQSPDCLMTVNYNDKSFSGESFHQFIDSEYRDGIYEFDVSIDGYKTQVSEDNYCTVYITGGTNIYGTIVNEGVPTEITLSYNLPKYTYVLPNVENAPYLYVELDKVYTKGVEVVTKINQNTHKYTLYKSTYINIGDDYTNYCNDETCSVYITFINLSDDDEEEVHITFSYEFYGGYQPMYIQKNKLHSFATQTEGITYFYTDVKFNEVGEVVIDFKKGGGIFYAKLVGKDEVEQTTNWNDKLLLPSPESYDYKSEEQMESRFIYTADDSQQCQNGCELYISVEDYDDKREKGSFPLSMEYSIQIITQEKPVEVEFEKYTMGYFETQDDYKYYQITIPIDIDRITLTFNAKVGYLYINEGETKPTKEEHKYVISAEQKSIDIKASELSNSASLYNVTFTIGVVNHNPTPEEYAYYKFKVSPQPHENFKVSFLSSEIPEQCETNKENNLTCYFIAHMNNYDLLTKYFVYAYVNDNPSYLLNMYSNIVNYENMKLVSELLISDFDDTLFESHNNYQQYFKTKEENYYVLIKVQTDIAQNVTVFLSGHNGLTTANVKSDFPKLLFIPQASSVKIMLNFDDSLFKANLDISSVVNELTINVSQSEEFPIKNGFEWNFNLFNKDDHFILNNKDTEKDSIAIVSLYRITQRFNDLKEGENTIVNNGSAFPNMVFFPIANYKMQTNINFNVELAYAPDSEVNFVTKAYLVTDEWVKKYKYQRESTIVGEELNITVLENGTSFVSFTEEKMEHTDYNILIAIDKESTDPANYTASIIKYTTYYGKNYIALPEGTFKGYTFENANEYMIIRIDKKSPTHNYYKLEFAVEPQETGKEIDYDSTIEKYRDFPIFKPEIDFDVVEYHTGHKVFTLKYENYDSFLITVKPTPGEGIEFKNIKMLVKVLSVENQSDFPTYTYNKDISAKIEGNEIVLNFNTAFTSNETLSYSKYIAKVCDSSKISLNNLYSNYYLNDTIADCQSVEIEVQNSQTATETKFQLIKSFTSYGIALIGHFIIKDTSEEVLLPYTPVELKGSEFEKLPSTNFVTKTVKGNAKSTYILSKNNTKASYFKIEFGYEPVYKKENILNFAVEQASAFPTYQNDSSIIVECGFDQGKYTYIVYQPDAAKTDIMISFWKEGAEGDVQFLIKYISQDNNVFPRVTFQEDITAVISQNKYVNVEFYEVLSDPSIVKEAHYHLFIFDAKQFDSEHSLRTIDTIFTNMGAIQRETFSSNLDGKKREVSYAIDPTLYSDEMYVALVFSFDRAESDIDERVAFNYIKITPKKFEVKEAYKYHTLKVTKDNTMTYRLLRGKPTDKLYQIEIATEPLEQESYLIKVVPQKYGENIEEAPELTTKSIMKKQGKIIYIVEQQDEFEEDILVTFSKTDKEAETRFLMRYETAEKEEQFETFTFNEDVTYTLEESTLKVKFNEVFSSATDIVSSKYYISVYDNSKYSVPDTYNTVYTTTSYLKQTTVSALNDGSVREATIDLGNDYEKNNLYITVVFEFAKATSERKLAYKSTLIEQRKFEKLEGNTYNELTVTGTEYNTYRLHKEKTTDYYFQVEFETVPLPKEDMEVSVVFEKYKETPTYTTEEELKLTKSRSYGRDVYLLESKDDADILISLKKTSEADVKVYVKYITEDTQSELPNFTMEDDSISTTIDGKKISVGFKNHLDASVPVAAQSFAISVYRIKDFYSTETIHTIFIDNNGAIKTETISAPETSATIELDEEPQDILYVNVVSVFALESGRIFQMSYNPAKVFQGYPALAAYKYHSLSIKDTKAIYKLTRGSTNDKLYQIELATEPLEERSQIVNLVAKKYNDNIEEATDLTIQSIAKLQGKLVYYVEQPDESEENILVVFSKTDTQKEIHFIMRYETAVTKEQFETFTFNEDVTYAIEDTNVKVQFNEVLKESTGIISSKYYISVYDNSKYQVENTINTIYTNSSTLKQIEVTAYNDGSLRETTIDLGSDISKNNLYITVVFEFAKATSERKLAYKSTSIEQRKFEKLPSAKYNELTITGTEYNTYRLHIEKPTDYYFQVEFETVPLPREDMEVSVVFEKYKETPTYTTEEDLKLTKSRAYGRDVYLLESKDDADILISLKKTSEADVKVYVKYVTEDSQSELPNFTMEDDSISTTIDGKKISVGFKNHLDASTEATQQFIVGIYKLKDFYSEETIQTIFIDSNKAVKMETISAPQTSVTLELEEETNDILYVNVVSVFELANKRQFKMSYKPTKLVIIPKPKAKEYTEMTFSSSVKIYTYKLERTEKNNIFVIEVAKSIPVLQKAKDYIKFTYEDNKETPTYKNETALFDTKELQNSNGVEILQLKYKGTNNYILVHFFTETPTTSNELRVLDEQNEMKVAFKYKVVSNESDIKLYTNIPATSASIFVGTLTVKFEELFDSSNTEIKSSSYLVSLFNKSQYQNETLINSIIEDKSAIKTDVVPGKQAKEKLSVEFSTSDIKDDVFVLVIANYTTTDGEKGMIAYNPVEPSSNTYILIIIIVLAVLIVLAIGGFFIIKLLGKRRMKKDLLSLGGGIGEKIDFKDDAKEINLVEQGSSEA